MDIVTVLKIGTENFYNDDSYCSVDISANMVYRSSKVDLGVLEELGKVVKKHLGPYYDSTGSADGSVYYHQLYGGWYDEVRKAYARHGARTVEQWCRPVDYTRGWSVPRRAMLVDSLGYTPSDAVVLMLEDDREVGMLFDMTPGSPDTEMEGFQFDFTTAGVDALNDQIRGMKRYYA